MNNPKVKLLLLISLLAALGGVIAAFAAGTHLQVGLNDGAFNCDFRVATGHSGAATVLGWIALGAGLIGIGLHVSGGVRTGNNSASGSGPGGWSGFSNLPGALRRLTKSRTDVWLGGVCGGLGEHTPLPSWVWRVVFLFLLCWYGVGALAYVSLWICLPEPRPDAGRPGLASGTAASAIQ